MGSSINNLERIVASPTFFICGRRSIILYPLTLKEWVFLESCFNRMDKRDYVEIVFHAVWLSIRKQDVRIKQHTVSRWFRWRKKALINAFNTIATISLPEHEEITKSKTNNKKPQKTKKVNDYRSFLRFFAEGYGWDIEQVSNLTPLQIHGYIKAAPQKGMKANSLQEARQLLHQMRSVPDGV